MQYSTSHSSRLGNRKSNQDRCTIFENKDAVLLVVADGMGGHEGGELAAQTFVSTLEKEFKRYPLAFNLARNWLKNAVLKAHLEIQKIKTRNGQSPRTTCICCLIQDGKAFWIHSGDSRLYLFRNNRVYMQTHDHTHVADLVKNHVISESEVNLHPMRNYVTACIGGNKTKPHISIANAIDLKADDLLLLCSDGLWSALENTELLNILKQPNLEHATDQLTKKAEASSWPKSDNISAVSFHYISLEKTSTAIHTEPGPSKLIEKKDNNNISHAINEINEAYKLYQKELSQKDKKQKD